MEHGREGGGETGPTGGAVGSNGGAAGGSPEWPERLRGILESGPALLGAVGLIVYAVVRVAHDGFYSRFALSAEDVGLTQTTILARAALYLAFFLTTAGALAGLWLVAMPWLTRTRSVDAAGGNPAWRFLVRHGRSLFVGSLLVALLVPVLALSPLAPGLTRVLADVTPEEACREGNRFCGTATVFGSALDLLSLLGILALLVLLAIGLALVLPPSRIKAWSDRRLWSAAASLALLTLGVAVVAPDLIKVLGDLPEDAGVSRNLLAPLDPAELGWLERHPALLTWAVFLPAAFGLAATLVSVAGVLGRPASRSEREDTDEPYTTRSLLWAALALVAILPLLVALLAPELSAFVTTTISRLLAAIVLCAGLAAVVLVAVHREAARRTATDGPGAAKVRVVVVATAVAMIGSSALLLAWERGRDRAEFAAVGNRIVPARFGLLSVRTDVVCLVPLVQGGDRPMQEGPYLYLGAADGKLALFDYQRARSYAGVPNKPRTLPVRLPEGGVGVAIAELAPNGVWSCPPNAPGADG